MSHRRERGGKAVRAVRALLIGLLLMGLAAPGRGEVIDRILAVVGSELIMLSDVSAALRFGLVTAPAPGADPIRAALDALIARELELEEVNRYLPPEPSPAALQARFDAVRARFASDAALEAALTQAGLTLNQLRLRLRDDLRIETYLDQRFGSLLQPRDEELVDYYRANEAEFVRNGELRPFAEVREEVRSRLVTQQRRALIAEWLDGLRRRSEVNDLYLNPENRSGAL